MADPAVGIAQPQIAASILLLIYAAAVVVLLPREMSFLKSVKKSFRLKFIILDVLFQITILLVLIPPMISKMDNKVVWIVFGIGFAGLWIIGTWLAMSRYIYTYRYLIKQHDQVKSEIENLQQQAKMEGNNSD